VGDVVGAVGKTVGIGAGDAVGAVGMTAVGWNVIANTMADRLVVGADTRGEKIFLTFYWRAITTMLAMSSAAPTIPEAVNRSPSKTIASSAEPSGSSRVIVAAVVARTLRIPRT